LYTTIKEGLNVLQSKNQCGTSICFFGYSQVHVFENKKFKELSKFEFLFLINSKKCPMSLTNPKRGDYEVGVRIRVCD
jgi:hypothetical protein